MTGDAVTFAVIAVREAYEAADPVLIDPALRSALDALCDVDLLDPGTPAARRRDPDTSQQGAASVKMRAGSQRAKLLRAFAYAYDTCDSIDSSGLTSDEARARAELPLTSCYWKRVSELAQGHMVEPILGLTRPGDAGDPQTVYRLTDLGRAALRGIGPEMKVLPCGDCGAPMQVPASATVAGHGGRCLR